MTEFGRVGHHPDEEQRKLEYLARFICDLKPGNRGDYLARMQLRHGEQYSGKVRELVNAELDRRAQK